MKIVPLNEITMADEGKILDAVSGVLVNLFEQKKGTTEAGKPWAMQNGLLEGNGIKMKVCFNSREAMPTSLRGQQCLIESQRTKHGYQGVKVAINEYKGIKTVELRITGAALVTFPNASEGTVAMVEPSERIENVTPLESEMSDGELCDPGFNPSNNVHVNQNVKKSTVSSLQKTRHRMMQLANLYSMAWNAAAFLSESNSWDVQNTKDVASCLYIQAVREGYADQMPNNSPIVKSPKQPPSEYSQADAEF